MTSPNSSRTTSYVALAVMDCTSDPLPQALGHLVPALHRDHDAELGLEVERLEAGQAGVEVLLYLDAPTVCQLAVEEVVEAVHRLVAVTHHDVRRGLAPYRTHTTPSRAL